LYQSKYYESKLLLISNLLLGEKLVRASAPKILNSFGKFGGNPWDALRASRILASKKPFSSLMVQLYDQIRTSYIQSTPSSVDNAEYSLGKDGGKE